MSHKVGDIIEQDGEQMRVIDIKGPIEYEQGEAVTVITYEPIENEA